MFSPTSIANFLACQHRTALDRAEAAGEIKRPFFANPGLDLLVKLGLEHEETYLRVLAEEQNLDIAKIPSDIPWKDAGAHTVDAIRRGAEVIYQATFLSEQWQGRADFLIRVDKPSALGPWSYEVVETKLARSTKARAIIQLCFYSDLLSTIQGVVPDYMHVVLGGGAKPEKFSVHRYLAYFRKVRREFEAANQLRAETYPEPVDHCRVCIWSSVCEGQWRDDDHLSLVAGISRNQRKVLVECGVSTVRGLASPQLPPIEGIGAQALTSIREQARLQVQGRDEGRYIYELLEPSEEKGLCSLPPPSLGDIFLDFEGDPFAFEQGLEYLFGVLTLSDDKGNYSPIWALDRAEEKIAFENFIVMVTERRRQHPDMHIYHYGAYEETAIKRMAGRHGTCVDEVDDLLRAGVLVDLYRAVKQGLRASVESYSIKKLEPLYEFKREVQLIDANLALNTFQSVLAFGSGEEDIAEIRAAIEGYNRDDCVSALRLRDWLEDRRRELEARIGAPLPRPLLKTGEPTEDLSVYLERVRAVSARLVADVPEDESERTDEHKGQWLLAQLLEWHRREDKSAWWEYFRLCELADQELQEDKSALGGLVYEGVVGETKRSLIHRYRFPLQDHAIDRAPSVHDPRTQKGVGEIVEIDERMLTIDIKRGASSLVPHPTALIPHDIINATVLRESLLQLGSWVADNGIDAPGRFRAARDLLLRRPPRLGGDTLHDLLTKNPESIEVAKQAALALDQTVLPIQGPPGSGKTYTGARMIAELVRNGLRVGITAVSHKVISKLLKDTCEAAREAGVNLKALQRVDSGDSCEDALVARAKNNEAVVNALAGREAQIAAGTVWLWARPDMADAVDVLFVDEAGQMSLANVLAASPAAKSIVLLGDPQQLDQPQRGVHPLGAEASALSHLLNGRATIGADQGLFLAEKALVKQCEESAQPANVENVLSRVRMKIDAIGEGETLVGLNRSQLCEIETTICTVIAKTVSPSEDKIPKRMPHNNFADWVKKVNRTSPLEIFTTNYDILFERAFEASRVPVFDGFVGTHNPFFYPECLEDEDLLPEAKWIRLWKLHGSVNWHREKDAADKRIIRTQPSESGEMILPSHWKYDESRKQPYMAYMDRLSRILNSEHALLITCGYSFSDEHFNAIVYGALDNRNTSNVIALQFQDLKETDRLIDAAVRRSNLTVIGPNGGVISGTWGTWQLTQPVDNRTCSFMDIGFDSNALPEDGGSPVAGAADLTGKMRLGDFNWFCRFLNAMGPEIQ